MRVARISVLAFLLDSFHNGETVILGLSAVWRVHVLIVRQYKLLHVLYSVLSFEICQLTPVKQYQGWDTINLDEVRDIVLGDGVFQVVFGVSPVNS